jgi:hypothetical protein
LIWPVSPLKRGSAGYLANERGGHRMKKFLSESCVVLLFLAVNAIAQDVRYNFDKSTDFSKFTTYRWVELKGAERLDDLTDKQLKAALDVQLAMKGLMRINGDEADLYIGYQASVGQEKQFTSYSSDWGYGPGWGGAWYGGMGSSMTTGQTSTIYRGQLALDMYDAAHHSLVWRGVASKTLDPKAKPEKRQKNIEKAAAKLLKNYPSAGKR